MIKHTFFYLLLAGLVACTTEEKIEDDQFFVKEEQVSDVEYFQQLSDSLEKHPNNIGLWIEKGTLCKDNLDFDCALDAGAKAYRLDSTNIKARQLYAWTLINKTNAPISDIDRAQRHYQYILSRQPNDPQTLVELANTYSLTGDFKTAIKYINDALKIDERYRDGYVLKGSIYKTLDKNDLALSSYQTAVQIDPEFFMGHLNTGWLLTSMEEHQLALEYYQNAVELKPDNLNAIYGVAKSLQDLGKYEAALVEYRKLSKIKPEFYISYFNQAYIKQYHQNELDSATYFYGEVLDLNPKYVHAWYQLGETYKEQGRISEAGKAYSEAVKIDRSYTPAFEAAEKLRILR
ncbi:MAG TPA: tetratricopeptide repeat protein [Brumimicrobium sp.]|nr:tetratricopeptide repeat protein [Brumimicrobium sp.]